MKDNSDTSSKGGEGRGRMGWYGVKVTGRLAVVLVVLAVGVQVALRSVTALHKFDQFLTLFQDVDEHLKHHFYLAGNYAPVATEHVSVEVPVIDGTTSTLPPDLDGVFVRNGPNPVFRNKRHHWFDGNGMLHNLRIKNGKASYSNQFIPTPRYNIEKAAGEQVFWTIGELTGITGLLKLLLIVPYLPAAFGLTSLEVKTANTNVLMYRDKLYCLNEASLPFEISLNEDGSIDKKNAVVGYTKTFGDTELNYPVSAHPKIDMSGTGNLVFHGYSTLPEYVKPDGPIKVGEWSANTLLQYIGLRFADDHLSFAHDMMFTRNWIIVVDSSVHFDPRGILDKDKDFFAWNPKNASLKVGFVSRANSDSAATAAAKQPTAEDAVWLDAGKPYSIIHTLNAWEVEDGTVVLWAPLGDSFDFRVDTQSAGNSYYMSELRMNPVTGTVDSVTRISNDNVEFPRIREDCLGRKCRYGYAGIMAEAGDGMFTGFVTYDLEQKKVHSVVRYPKSEFGGEPVVIPKPGSRVGAGNATNEDGSNHVYLGTFVYNNDEKQSYFVLFDGETTSQEPISRLRMPYRVPYGFHGLWVDGEDLKKHVQHNQHGSPGVSTE